MSKRRTLHVASQGFRPQLVEIAPDAEDPISKRFDLIKNEDNMLNANITELEEGTKSRNRAFQNRLDEIWSLTADWEAKLKTESREAAETILNMREQYEIQMEKFLASLLSETKQIFDRFDNQLLPAESERVDVIEANKEMFVKETVPTQIERQSGEVSRQLKKAYETFDIEKQKEAKREKKFVNRASDYLQNTAQRFNDEDALMAACFYSLEEDVVESERRAARSYDRKFDNSVGAIVELNNVMKAESTMRESEDIDVLMTVLETQKLLQKVVLEHFGDTDKLPGEEAVPFPKFPKLENRMKKKTKK